MDMARLLPKLLVSVVLAAFASQTALAGEPLFAPKRGGKGLFGDLFSSGNRKPRRPSGDLPWWLNDRPNTDVNVIYGTPGTAPKPVVARPVKPVAPVYEDPEPIPGLGMGLVAYQAPLQQPVADPAFARLAAASPEAMAIRDVLASRDSGIRAVQAERSAILAHYQASGFRPLWLESGTLSERARLVLAVLAQADKDGMAAEAYLPPVLASFDDPEAQLGGVTSKLAALDVGLTAAALKYARDARDGQFDPARLSLYNDIKVAVLDPAEALRTLEFSPLPQSWLLGLQPQLPQYQALKQALAEVEAKAAEANAITLAPGPQVKPGGSDPRLADLRRKLASLGFEVAAPANAMAAPATATVNSPAMGSEGLAITEPALKPGLDGGDPLVMDKELSLALKRFQKSVKLKATGVLDNAAVKALNADRSAEIRRKLAINMERMRWLPRDLGQRHVFVNQAAYDVRVMNSGREEWHSKVIVGRPMTQTSAFHDQMETVVFNPTWNVPESIVVNEYLPKLFRDPAYLDKQGFKVINAKGKVVKSASVNWGAYGSKPPFMVQQPSGGDNALGELKFLFPNQHSIYMHDTPTRSLFKQDVRAFSHGCVRVENPRDFAAVLLGWDREKVNALVDAGLNDQVALNKPIPVHITYFTAWPGSDGKIRYFDDIYGRDGAMFKALEIERNLRQQRARLKLVQAAPGAPETTGGLNPR